MKLHKSTALTIAKRTLDILIVLYLLLIPVIVATGGFKVQVLGIAVQATHVNTALGSLIPLALIRLFITLELANFLLLVGSILLSLSLMEVVVRIWDPPIANPRMTQLHQPSAIYGWELVPGASGYGALGEYYQINASGLRDKEYSRQKKPGVYRITVLGDSFTFGMGVNLEDTYPKRLEKILQEWEPNIEVINFGVVGHDMWQHYEMLKRRALSYHPDLVILALYPGDDFSESVAPYDESGLFIGDYPFVSFEQDPKLWGIMSRSALWNYLRHVNIQFEYKYRYRRGYKYVEGIEERKKKYGPLRPDHPFTKSMAATMEKHKFTEFSEALKSFVKTANQAGAKTLVVLIPDSVQLNDDYMQGSNRFAKQQCAKIKVPFLDMTPILEADEDHTSLYLFPFDGHNSPQGLNIIAQAIADRMMELGLLRVRDSGM